MSPPPRDFDAQVTFKLLLDGANAAPCALRASIPARSIQTYVLQLADQKFDAD